ncbi:MAG: ATP-binding protein [Candidatus Hinthialibacter antarcticus]|nr:ATP-binding protein [Candidatus Hinthialibacter antarcticus]
MSNRSGAPTDLALEINANSRWLHLVREFVNLFAQNLNLSQEDALQLEMCVDEACANSINAVEKMHADPEKCKVRIEVLIANGSIHITVVDCGADFSDPFHRALPMTGLTDRTRKRGYGLQIIKTLMDEVQYERDAKAFNRLHLIKFL